MRHLARGMDPRIRPTSDNELDRLAHHRLESLLNVPLNRANIILTGPTMKIGAIIGDVEAKTNQGVRGVGRLRFRVCGGVVIRNHGDTVSVRGCNLLDAS